MADAVMAGALTQLWAARTAVGWHTEDLKLVQSNL